MNYSVKYVKEGRTERMKDIDLINNFSDELSMHLMRMPSMQQVMVNSKKYGRVIIRKE